MSKLIHGRYSDCGTIIPLASYSDMIYQHERNSLLHTRYQVGKVVAHLYLAEFKDGEAIAATTIATPFCGGGEPLLPQNKKPRKLAIAEAKESIVRFLLSIIEDRSNTPARAIWGDCLAIIQQIRQRCLWE